MNEVDTEVHAKPRIELDEGEPATIRTLTAVIERGSLPDLYVTDGRIVRLERVSGDAGAAADDPLPLKPSPLDKDGFTDLLAHHAYVYETKRVRVKKGRKGKNGEPDEPDEYDYVERECSPPERALRSVLSGRYWPGVRPLRGIVGSPVLRPDGSLLQTVGYDRATGLYYAPKVALRPVPVRPSPAQVKGAKRFLARVLKDFPWVSKADKANYLGMLVSPILRPFVRSLVPFGLVTATAAGSGKTLLTELAGALYGRNQYSWAWSEEELRKLITAAFAEPEGVIVFDNIEEGSAVSSSNLARLITSTQWSDRRLGASTSIKFPNDRMWMANGNNLRLGGDMAKARTVTVSLDPNMPHPELRTGFAIPDLESWIAESANRQELLWNILVLVADWMAHDAPCSEHVMRQFTPWARATGGFVAHHGLPDFLGNAADTREMDEDEATWIAFFARWEERFGSQEIPSVKLRASMEREVDGSDPWNGTIPDAFLKNGRHLPSVESLGMSLRGQVGRWRGTYVLRRRHDTAANRTVWKVETAPGEGAT